MEPAFSNISLALVERGGGVSAIGVRGAGRQCHGALALSGFGAAGFRDGTRGKCNDLSDRLAKHRFAFDRNRRSASGQTSANHITGFDDLLIKYVRDAYGLSQKMDTSRILLAY